MDHEQIVTASRGNQRPALLRSRGGRGRRAHQPVAGPRPAPAQPRDPCAGLVPPGSRRPRTLAHRARLGYLCEPSSAPPKSCGFRCLRGRSSIPTRRPVDRRRRTCSVGEENGPAFPRTRPLPSSLPPGWRNAAAAEGDRGAPPQDPRRRPHRNRGTEVDIGRADLGGPWLGAARRRLGCGRRRHRQRTCQVFRAAEAGHGATGTAEGVRGQRAWHPWRAEGEDRA